MLLKVVPGGSTGGGTSSSTKASYKPVQVALMNEVALFSQELISPTTNATTTAGFANHLRHLRDHEPDTILVRYHAPPPSSSTPAHPSQSTPLLVPLRPDAEFLASRPTVPVSLMGSPGFGHRMGEPYDGWFSACLGYEAHLVYVGDFEREVLAHAPLQSPSASPSVSSGGGSVAGPAALSSWLPSVISSYIPSLFSQTEVQQKKPTLVYNECAPFLVTNRASLRDFSQRFEDEGSTGMDMTKFRPNIVVDTDSNDDDDDNNNNDNDQVNIGHNASVQRKALQPWEEDYWAELTIHQTGNINEAGSAIPSAQEGEPQPRPCCKIQLTANCGRCTSINVDYATGRPAAGEQGTALKKLMRDRRVDAGEKYTPIFGRYGYLVDGDGGGGNGSGDGLVGGQERFSTTKMPGQEDGVSTGQPVSDKGPNQRRGVQICVGDRVVVSRRNEARDVWAWPQYKN